LVGLGACAVLRSVIRWCASIRSAAKSRRGEVVRGVVERRAGAVPGAVLQTTTAERLVVDGRQGVGLELDGVAARVRSAGSESRARFRSPIASWRHRAALERGLKPSALQLEFYFGS